MNILEALYNIYLKDSNQVIEKYFSNNWVNNMGDALEIYIKDIFSGVKNDNERDILYSKTFSYLGNKNNPPDCILRGSDAIEIKKIENIKSDIALNSSYPKNKLYVNDSRITKACRECENWDVKDIIYSIGYVPKNSKNIKTLFFIYGDCYAADKEVYEKIPKKIEEQLRQIDDIDFIKTNELAKVKKVDPLGITDLRVRGMWNIQNPIKVFQDIVGNINLSKQILVYALMKKEKFDNISKESKNKILNNKNFVVKDIKIKDPNNPAKLLEAKFIKYAK